MTAFAKHIDRCDQSHVSLSANGTGVILEPSDGGRGEVHVNAPSPSIYFNNMGGKYPIGWLKSRKCSDGSVYYSPQDNTAHLALIELKSSLSKGALEKAIDQFDDGYLNSLAIIGAIEENKPTHLKCVISYTSEKITDQINANPSILRSIQLNQGAKCPDMRAYHAWVKKKVHISHFGECDLLTCQRDAKTGIGSINL